MKPTPVPTSRSAGDGSLSTRSVGRRSSEGASGQGSPQGAHRHLVALGPAGAPRPATGRIVLVVEDDQKLCQLICGVFERRHIEAHGVSTGDGALLAVRRENPDAVVLDIMIPHPDGIEVAHQLRRDGWMGPVVMISARDTPEDRRRALAAGADRFFAKPFALATLAKGVESLLSGLERPSGDRQPHRWPDPREER